MTKAMGVPIVVFLLSLGVGGVHPTAVLAQSGADRSYVGSEACRECHEAEYANYLEFAKKANSFDSIQQMKPQLTPAEFQECLECHTTGHGRPGGFRSEAATPNLRNAGCEVCHGPGSRHVLTADTADIVGTLTREDCESCHNQDRIEAFGYKPMIYGGGH